MLSMSLREAVNPKEAPWVVGTNQTRVRALNPCPCFGGATYDADLAV